jgi:thioredoxin 1
MNARYSEVAPSRTEVDALAGNAVIEFGTGWCGVCRAAQPAIAAAFAKHPDVRHLRIADGPGRPLGRSFGVKLWPTLILLRDGKEIERLVRPRNEAAIDAALDRLTAV